MDSEIKDILVKLLEDQTRLETEVNKNSIKLESIEKKIDIISEVQTAHKEHNSMAFKNTDAFLEDNIFI